MKTFEKLRALDGQDDGFLQCLLGALQSGNVVPFDVRLLHNDRLVDGLLQLLVLVRFLLAAAGVLVVLLDWAGLLLGAAIFQEGFQVLRAVHILLHSLTDDLLLAIRLAFILRIWNFLHFLSFSFIFF